MTDETAAGRQEPEVAALPLDSGPGLKLDLEWLDAGPYGMVELGPTRAEGLERLSGGGVRINSEAPNPVTFTHVESPFLTVAPERPLPVPSGPVELSVTFEGKDLLASFWLVEYRGRQRHNAQSWRVERNGVFARWEPKEGTTGIRLMLRLEGRGEVYRLEVSAAPASSGAGFSTGPMAIWRLLNRPVAELPAALDFASQVVSSTVKPQERYGPEPQVFVCPVGGAFDDLGKERLAALAIDPARLDIDIDVSEESLSVALANALRFKAYETVCPYSGVRLTSRDTFLVSEPDGRPYVFVRFESAGGTFYQIYCPFKSSKMGIYLAESEDIFATRNIAHVAHVFRTWMIYFSEQVLKYLKHPERITCVPVNSMAHWGHVFFNELPALREAEAEGLLSDIDLWLDCGVAFVDASVSVGGCPGRVAARVGRESAFAYLLQERAFVVRPGLVRHKHDAAVCRDLRAFCEGEAERTGYGDEVREKLAGRWPVLWMEIRGKGRRWLNQEEGTISFVSALLKRYPDLAVVLSGWSMMQSWRADDASNIGIELAAANRLLDSAPGLPIIPIVGVQTWKKVIWALNCDAYVVPEGSSISFALVNEGLDGLVLARREYHEGRHTGKQKEESRYWDTVPHKVLLTDIDEDFRFRAGHERDFHFSGEALADEFDAQVLQHLSRR